MSDSKQTLLPVYLVVGEDALKRRTVIERLRARVAQTTNLDFNHDQLDAEHVGAYDAVNACNMLPFDGDVRLVELDHIDKISKAAADALVDYLASPSPSTVLAVMGEKLAKNTRLYKAIAAFGKTAVIDCAPLKRYELVNAVRSMAVGHGFAMTHGAAEKLVELVGEDTVRIDAELGKLSMAHRGNDPVNEHEVSSLVARTAEAKPWEFVDAFAARDLAKALGFLRMLDSSSPFALLSMCTTRIRELICAQSLASRGESNQLATVLKVPSWRVKNHGLWARKYTRAELARAIVSARDCEKAMKGASGSSPEAVFKEWVVATCGSRMR